MMRALAWGSTHAKELTVFGYMMYLLFSHGSVIPKKMDFRHTQDWFETWLCVLLGVCPLTGSPSRVSASSLTSWEEGTPWSGHSGRLAEPPADGPTHRRACGCPARAGSRVHPAALPSRPPRLRRHSGLFQENDGSHGSGRWHPMQAPVFRLFVHSYFDLCPVCCEVHLPASALRMGPTGVAGARWPGNKDVARGHLPLDSVRDSCVQPLPLSTRGA